MADTALLNYSIEAGAALIRALDCTHLKVDTAGWILLSDRESWRFYIFFEGSPDQRQTLQTIAELIADRDDIANGLSIVDIQVVPESDRVLRAVKILLHTGDGVGFFRLHAAFANGVYIEDALVYRARDPLIPALA